MIYIKSTQTDGYCENIKKLTDGSFLLFGSDSWRRTWAYKLSAEGDYQWEFRGIQNAYVTAANQMSNGDITLLCYELYNRIHIIVLDSDGNLISVTYKYTNLWMAYDGVVGKNGVIVATDGARAFVMIKCHPGTYYSSDVGSCIPCPIMSYQDLADQDFCKDCLEGEYQDKEGQSSCEPCISYCESCTTGTSCLKCLAGFYLETEDSGEVSCADTCEPRYLCNGKYILNILSLY